MDSYVFINSAFTHMINSYLASKKQPESIRFNSFYVVVIRLLAIIYDELDILTPYNLKNETALYDNFQKYGYPKESINIFFGLLTHFYEEENSKDFLEIQKMIIDMFMKKKVTLNISDKEIENFKGLLYSKESRSPLQVSYNFMMTNNYNEVLEYFETNLKLNQKKALVTKPKEKLNLGAYEILKYSLEEIEGMSAEKLDDINKEVYNYFNINENAINKKYLLDKAVFDHNHPKPAYSTGNGYVDILFILSIIATVGMVILIVSLLVL